MKTLILLTAAVLVASAAFADTIKLKTGGKIEGIIIKEDAESVTIRIADIGTMVIKRKKIEKITRDDKDGSIHLVDSEEEKKIIEQEKARREKLEREFNKDKSEDKKEEPKPDEPAPDVKDKDEKPLPEPTEEEARDIEYNIQRLGHRKLSYRNNARAILVKFGAKALKSLFEALQSPGDWRRQFAAKAISEIGDKRAIKPLVKALSNKSKWTRKEVNAALEKITGKDMGFNHEADEKDQEKAIKKWNKYLADLKAAKAKKEEEKKKETDPEKPKKQPEPVEPR
jgi:hypothetical protein